MYIDTCIEPMGAPWNCGNVHLSERTNYHEREKVLALRKPIARGPAPILCTNTFGSCSIRSVLLGSPAPGTPTPLEKKFSSTARPGKTTQLVAVSATSGKSCMPLLWNEGSGPEEVFRDTADNGKQLLSGMNVLKANEITAAAGGAVKSESLISLGIEGSAQTAPVATMNGIDGGAAPAAPAAENHRIDDGVVAAAAAAEGSSKMMGGLPTAVLVSGANPGMVQHFVKAALWKMAEDCGMATGEGWRLLMRLLAMIADVSFIQ
jgi:hypothetical protein